MGPEHAWWGGMWFFPVLMPLFMLIGFAIIVSLFTDRGFFRSSRQDNNMLPTQSTESAVDILKKRYAKGEISKDEFEQIKEDLL